MFRVQWHLSRLLKLWMNIWMYAIGIGVLFWLLGKTPLAVPSLLNMFFPVLRQVWWFMSFYVLLYLCIPFLNFGLHQLTHRQFACLALGIVVVFYVLPVFAFFFPPFDVTEGMGIIGFITLYILGAYLGKENISLSWKRCIIGLVLNNLCIFLSKVLLEYIANKYHLSVGTGLLYHYNTILELLNAVLLLLLFKQISFRRWEKVIVWSSSSVFAVYLLHEHPLVRSILWQSGLLPILQHVTFAQFAIITFTLPLIILGTGILIDKFMQFVILGPIFHSKVWGRVITRCQVLDELFFQTGSICQHR